MKTDIIFFLIIISCIYLSMAFELTPNTIENAFMGFVIGFLIIAICLIITGEI